MNKVKITVLKTTFDVEIAKAYAVDGLTPFKAFKEGDVFIGGVKKPNGFCDTAWKCISQYVFALANGAGKDGFFFNDWAREPNTAISCCNDGLRPVIFKIEATDIPDSL
jgi:uncharacterized repeat protein (TIGR04076 family)